MREILFKARVDAPGRARWVEGLPCYSIKNRGKITGIIDKNSEVHPIDASTLGEFANFKLKGKKVFEGDIICNTLYENGKINKEYFTVVYDKSKNGFLGKSQYVAIDTIELWELSEGEIVGNIHENRKLLEVAV